MIETMLIESLRVIGCILVLAGGIFELIGAYGLIKLKDFQTRAHASTLTVVGGGVLPLIGVALLALTEMGIHGIYTSSISMLTSILILVTAPTGVHNLMRIALRHKNSSLRVSDEEG